MAHIIFPLDIAAPNGINSPRKLVRKKRDRKLTNDMDIDIQFTVLVQMDGK